MRAPFLVFSLALFGIVACGDEASRGFSDLPIGSPVKGHVGSTTPDESASSSTAAASSSGGPSYSCELACGDNWCLGPHPKSVLTSVECDSCQTTLCSQLLYACFDDFGVAGCATCGQYLGSLAFGYQDMCADSQSLFDAFAECSCG